MADWYTGWDGGAYENDGVRTADSLLTTVTASASAHTKGAWVELVASTLGGSSMTVFCAHNSVAGDYLLDIGIGAAGSEVVIVPNLHLFGGIDLTEVSIPIPLSIPRGARIAARAQCQASGSRTIRCGVAIHRGGYASSGLSMMTAYGIVTASSRGTSCDPGAVANTKTTVEIASSTGRPIRSLIVSICPSEAGLTLASWAGWVFDVQVGAASSEVVVIPNLHVRASSTIDNPRHTYIGPLPCAIPAGSRLSVAVQTDVVTDATDRKVTVSLYGLE